MSNVNILKGQYEQLGLMSELTEALEGIASYRIRQVKDRVLISKQFFNELWAIYSSLRVDAEDLQKPSQAKRDLFVVITSTAGLTGDIDEAIIQRVVMDYNKSTTDVVTIGMRGGALLHAKGIIPVHGFKLPEISRPIDTSPIVSIMSGYRRTFVYYQEFESLMVQRAGKIELLLEPQALKQEELNTIKRDNLIIAAEYLFEPNQEAVVAYLEIVMLGIALTQMILESQLSQFSARFTTMIAASARSKEAQHDMFLRWQAERRRVRDGAAHEVLYALNGSRT